MPLLWLRVALVLYGVGLAYALLALARRGQALARATLPLVACGALFHLVALAERAAAAGHLAPGTLDDAESLLAFLRDPKIVLSLLMWVVYMVLLYTRWNAGWRGRRAAFLSTAVFLAALGAFAANYFSGVHRYLTP